MKVINLFGAPSAGKSTLAADLFAKMKYAGMSVELVTEFAKSLTWSRRGFDLMDQIYIFAKQNHSLERLRDSVQYVVTDSPLLLSLIYQSEHYYSKFPTLVKEVFDSYDNFNVFVKRVKPYNPVGRNQTEHESNLIATQLWEMLHNSSYKFIQVTGDKLAAETVMSFLTNPTMHEIL